MERNLTMGIGFRHVIEDALAILKNEEVDQNRRDFVLQDVDGLLREAIKGLDLERRDSLFVGSANRNAFDTLQFFDHYLSTAGQEEWKDQLPEVQATFNNLLVGNAVEEVQKATSIGIFELLLQRSKWQDFIGVPLHPEEIKIA